MDKMKIAVVSALFAILIAMIVIAWPVEGSSYSRVWIRMGIDKHYVEVRDPKMLKIRQGHILVVGVVWTCKTRYGKAGSARWVRIGRDRLGEAG